MQRILIADDHELMRKGLRVVIESEPGWEVCGEAKDGRQAVECAKLLRPDMAVIDISMPVMNGLEAARAIHQSGIPVRVLLFSTHDSSHFMAEARKIGAHGYVCKSSGEQNLIEAMHTVLQGQLYFGEPADTGNSSAFSQAYKDVTQP